MKKKILLTVDKNQFLPFDYNQSTEDAMQSMGMNSGNNVFGFALQKMILSKDFDIDMKPIKWVWENTDKVNNEYDLALYSPANILSKYAVDINLKNWTEALKKIKIPFNFVGVGSQSDRFYNLSVVNQIKKEGYEFIKSILETGGKIGLRGHFTANVVKGLGFAETDFTVTGCPSLFMNGPDLKIEKNDITQDNLKIIFNGNHFWFNENYHHYFYDYPDSIFVCQDILYPLLYSIQDFDKKNLYFTKGNLFYDMFKDNRVKLYCDYLAWNKDIKENNFNFCVGSRIHGNITSLLAGIPSFIDTTDSRVRELAEFFDIPNQYIKDSNTDMFKLYEKSDYENFNKTFASKFNNFKNFMNSCGLPCLDDMDYINSVIGKLHFQIPLPKTTKYDILKLSDDIKIINKYKKSKMYRLLHFYWKGKK